MRVEASPGADNVMQVRFARPGGRGWEIGLISAPLGRNQGRRREVSLSCYGQPVKKGTTAALVRRELSTVTAAAATRARP
jgi:hypothetical protein